MCDAPATFRAGVCSEEGASHMTSLHERFAAFIQTHNVQAEHLIFAQSTHSVAEAAAAANATPEDFVKSICFVTKDGRVVVAIVKGEDRVDRSVVQQLLGLSKLSIASPEAMLAKTGFPAGGTPPFGFEATFLMDERVFEREFVYAGGGSERSLIKISPSELQRVNGALAVKIRKDTSPRASDATSLLSSEGS